MLRKVKAAEQENASAAFNLGLFHANGNGVPQNYTKAAEWYTRAAGQGHSDAQLNLGILYKNGQGVPEDFVQAHKWWILSSMNGNEIAKENIEVEDKLTPGQIAEAQRLAQEWVDNQ